MSQVAKPAIENDDNEKQISPEQQQLLVQEFHKRKQDLETLQDQIGKVRVVLHEHRRVVKQLTPMKKDRKCFRNVQGVLIESNVEETLPILNENVKSFEDTLKKMEIEHKEKNESMSKFMIENNIRVRQAPPGTRQ